MAKCRWMDVPYAPDAPVFRGNYRDVTRLLDEAGDVIARVGFNGTTAYAYKAGFTEDGGYRDERQAKGAAMRHVRKIYGACK